MSSVIVSGDTSGSISITAPLVAGSGVLTLPVATDTLVGKATTDTLTNKTLTSPTITGATITVASTAAPAFSAYQSTLQSVANTTFTKVQCQTEEFDTNSNYDNATNYRFTPTVAGYYQVSASIGFTSASSIIPTIYKNGGEYKRGLQGTTTVFYQSGMSILVYLNGSTDYIEFYCYQASGASLNTTTGVAQTYFQAAMIRSA